tara:strand:+ start:27183 stop:28280 length:1098 start_codon:yes stop_codon:yes gene_type:complete
LETILWAGTRKGLVKFENLGNADWQLIHTSFAGEPVSMVLADDRDRTLYVALNLEHFGPKLHRSEDGGLSWTEIQVPAFPVTDGDPEAASDAAKRLSVEQVFCLEKGTVAGEIWAGTIPCGLFRSRNRGESWELINSLTDMENCANWFGGGTDAPALHSICINPENPQQVRVAISCGGVWESNDGCHSWESRTHGMRAAYMPPEQAFNPDAQDPHCLVVSASDQDRLWVQHHNGIFKSVDGGLNWLEIEEAGPSVFGFAVAVHPTEPDTAWFVPGVKDECRMPVDNKLVVTRTRDGGKSFDVLSNGLPQQHSFDLIYRHGLALGADGTQLAIGSTSGNLWLSADQGDNWQELSHTLAPVYCLRFA